MFDFSLNFQSSTEAVITWEPFVYENGSAPKITVTALPVDGFSCAYSGRVDISPGSARMHSLRPFTLYKFIIKETNENAILAEIGPIRSWPSGDFHFFFLEYAYFDKSTNMCVSYFSTGRDGFSWGSSILS